MSCTVHVYWYSCVLLVLVTGSEPEALGPAKRAKTEVQCYECKGFRHFKNKFPLLVGKASLSS